MLHDRATRSLPTCLSIVWLPRIGEIQPDRLKLLSERTRLTGVRSRLDDTDGVSCELPLVCGKFHGLLHFCRFGACDTGPAFSSAVGLPALGVSTAFRGELFVLTGVQFVQERINGGLGRVEAITDSLRFKPDAADTFFCPSGQRGRVYSGTGNKLYSCPQ